LQLFVPQIQHLGFVLARQFAPLGLQIAVGVLMVLDERGRPLLLVQYLAEQPDAVLHILERAVFDGHGRYAELCQLFADFRLIVPNGHHVGFQLSHFLVIDVEVIIHERRISVGHLGRDGL